MSNKSFTLCDKSGIEWRIARSTPGQYSEEVCSFDISLNNPRCTGKGLECLLAWASQRFASYEFSLADTLYTHTYVAIGTESIPKMTFKDANEQTRHLGHIWVKENEATIHKYLDNNFRIRRWDEWRAHPELSATIKAVQHLFEHVELKPLVVKDATAFLERKYKNREADARQLQALVDFIIEECAVYYLHSRAMNVRHVYPGQSLSVLRFLSKHTVQVTPQCDALTEVFRFMKRTNIDLRNCHAN